MDILILVNGPGETASYVKPAVEALSRLGSGLRIIVVLTPCPYSTGREIEIAGNIKGVSRVIGVNEFLGWALWRRPPKNIDFSRKGIVVFMGGDLLYGKIIAKRLKYPAIAYSESYAKWPKVYRKFLVPDQFIFDKFKRSGFPSGQMKVVGNLMVDGISPLKDKRSAYSNLGLDPNRKLVSFLPGSREFQVQFTINFFAGVIERMAEKRNDCQFAFIISPYLQQRVFERYMLKSGFNVINGYIRHKNTAIRIIDTGQQDAIAASDLVITIPGTNTAEVAAIGTPMIVVFPEESSQMIPLEGACDLVGKLPVLGFLFKKLYVKIKLRMTRFFAIPNIKTGSEVVPELKGHVTGREIAEKADAMLNDPARLARISGQLKASLGGPGASEIVAKEILNEVLHQAP